MKIAFVHLGRENLGIEYLSAVLKKAGHKTNLISDPGLFSREDNVFYTPFLEKIFEKRDWILKGILESKPDLIAFSVYTSTYKWACSVAKDIKEVTDVPIIFGGIHPTLLPEKVIANYFVDYVVVGEGEDALLELVESLSSNKINHSINNVWLKDKGKVISNRVRPPINNLDSLPLPDKELFEKDVRYRDDYMIMTARGCIFGCSFCCESYLNKLYNDKYFRRRSIDSVMEELRRMKDKYNFKEVMFFDSILFTDKKWLKELAVRFKKEIGVPFRCTGHVKCFDWDIGKIMKENGCYCIDFGVESLDKFTRENILNRFESQEQIKNAFNICERLGLRYDVDLMFGLPGETEEKYVLPIDFFKHSKHLNRLKCYNLTYYPKIEITNIARNDMLLSEREIKEIEDGRIGDWFHLDFLKDTKTKRLKDNFQVFYKIFPILPKSWISYIIRHKLYRKFYIIPSPVLIILQLIIAIRHKDYRFIIYPLNYLHHLKKRLRYCYGKSAN